MTEHAKSLTGEQKVVLAKTVMPPNVARLPSQGERATGRAVVSLAVRQMNGLTHLAQAGLGGA